MSKSLAMDAKMYRATALMIAIHVSRGAANGLLDTTTAWQQHAQCELQGSIKGLTLCEGLQHERTVVRAESGHAPGHINSAKLIVSVVRRLDRIPAIAVRWKDTNDARKLKDSEKDAQARGACRILQKTVNQREATTERALAAKFRERSVSLSLDIVGEHVAKTKVFELPPKASSRNSVSL